MEGAFIDLFTQGEMSEQNGRLDFTDSTGGFLEKLHRLTLNLGVGGPKSIRAVKADKLPSLVLQRVIELFRKDLFVLFAVALRYVVMISGEDKNGNAELSKKILHGAKLLLSAMMRQITRDQGELGRWTGFDLLQDAVQEGGAFFVDVVDVINDDEMEIPAISFAFRPQGTWPKPQGKQGSRTEMEHLPARKRMMHKGSEKLIR